MDPFTADYLANLAAGLTAQVIAAAGRRLRDAVAGSEAEQALRRSVQAGLVGLLATASAGEPEAADLLAEIFRAFFADPDVGREVAGLLRGNALDGQEMAYLFEQAGFEAETLPGLNLKQGMTAFEAAFLAAAVEEPALQGIVQVGQLLAQTRLQREMAAAMHDLIEFVRQARPGSVGIRAGQITAENVVSGVQIVYQLPRADLTGPPADWEAHYMRTLISRCDPLDLALIDEAQPQGDERVVRVSDVFITLYLDRLARAPSQTVADAIRRPGQLGFADRTDREPEREERLPIQAVEAVAALPRLVILGQPGGGKSTLVNHIAAQLARRRLGEAPADDKLSGWPADARPLPVVVILRRFAAWLPAGARRGEAGLVWGYLEHLLERCGCREAFRPLKQALADQGGIIFFDGLDEVLETDEEAKRSLIKEAIADFAAPLPRCQVIVTCREYAYKQGDAWRLPAAEFPTVELAPFGPEQIEAFTRTWYGVVGPQKGWDALKCQDEAANLYAAIDGRPHLRELAQVPLLLTLMAQVHGRDGTLPDDRADLYERAVNLLLAHWENRIVRDVDGRRKVEPGLVMQLGVPTAMLRAALERTAFGAHERQEGEEGHDERAADIPKEELREALLADLGSLDRVEQVIAYVQERAGLLLARDNRTYAFPHRTFQEYLAATYLLKQGEFDRLLRERVRRAPVWWEEVFLLAAGASRRMPRLVSDLVDCLLPLAPGEQAISAERAAEARLAGLALCETGFAAHARQEQAAEPGRYAATHGRAQAWLLAAIRADERVPAQERAACGDVLARLGDPRFRDDAWFLPDEPLLGFVPVPAGRFRMGTRREEIPALRERFGGEQRWYEYETPQHEPELPGYYVARYPVTHAQYWAFVQATGHAPPAADLDWERPYEWRDGKPPARLLNHPVVLVTWHDAQAYCRWLTERLWEWTARFPGSPTGRAEQEFWAGLAARRLQVQLPSEAEWERAARGTDGRIFPWEGDQADPNRANYDDTGIGATSAVGCFPGGASPYGIEELSGNVWEWCRTRWREDYTKPADESLEGNDHRVLRGGAFLFDQDLVRCAYRSRLDPYDRDDDVGFRVVVVPV